MRQGKHIGEDKIERIARLLRDTDAQIGGIAERMGVSRSAVIAINRRLRIRSYDGKRMTWRHA